MREVDGTYHLSPQAKWVKANAPKVHGVTATHEGLAYLAAKVSELTGRDDSFIFISPNRFHDHEAMEEASEEFGQFMEHHWVRRPTYVYISNSDGSTPRFGRQVRIDLVKGVMGPVNFYTGKEDSVVGRAKALGVNIAVVFNLEIASWLRGSSINPLLMTSYGSMVRGREELLTALTTQPQKEQHRAYAPKSKPTPGLSGLPM